MLEIHNITILMCPPPRQEIKIKCRCCHRICLHKGTQFTTQKQERMQQFKNVLFMTISIIQAKKDFSETFQSQQKTNNNKKKTNKQKPHTGNTNQPNDNIISQVISSRYTQKSNSKQIIILRVVVTLRPNKNCISYYFGFVMALIVSQYSEVLERKSHEWHPFTRCLFKPSRKPHAWHPLTRCNYYEALLHVDTSITKHNILATVSLF